MMGILLKNTEEQNPDIYYQNSAFVKPGYFKSVFENMAGAATEPFVRIKELSDDQFAHSPEAQSINNFYAIVNADNASPVIGGFQKASNYIAGLIGSSLNPLTWVGVGLGGVATKGLLMGAQRIAPSIVTTFAKKPIAEMLNESLAKYIQTMIGKKGAEEALSLSLVGKKAVGTFNIFAGAGIPGAIAENYNQQTNSLNWGGTARSIGESGALGLAIGSIPFAWGVIRAKINRFKGEAPNAEVKSEDLSAATAARHTSSEEAQWYQDLATAEKSGADRTVMQKLKQRASKIIADNGYKVNTATHEAPVEIISAQDMTNLQGAISDQLAANGQVPDNFRSTLSDFVVHNSLDALRNDPKTLDGVRGYSDFVGKKLESKPVRIAEADRLVDEHLLKAVKENMPLSQKKIFKLMEKMQFEPSHLQHFPFTIPENMLSRAKDIQKIRERKLKASQYQKILEKTGDPNYVKKIEINNEKISQLEKRTTKILTPKEELTSLRKSLLTTKGLTKNWQRSNAYHRLIDLAQVWHNAKTLLDRVHIEAEYERQAAFKTLADHILNVADSTSERLAKPESVIDYLKKRIEGSQMKAESDAEVKKIADETLEVPQDAEKVINEQTEQLKESGAEELVKDHTEAVQKFEEFKKSEGVFKQLIECVMGKLNAG
jgi:hypothetical protein